MQRKTKENQRTDSAAYRFGEFDLYPGERTLYRRQKPVTLQPKVFDAMLLLVQSAERLVLRDELIRTLWPDTFVTEANLTNIIVILRKVLGKDAIQTVSKYGYRFTLRVHGEPGIPQTTYATFLRAKELMAVRSLDSMVKARELLWLCLASDPAFAPGWAWFGRCCRFLEKFRVEPDVNFELAQSSLRRALAIDPNLACAHHFYTHLQTDMGEARQAMLRLAERLNQRGEEPETLAGLVTVLRCCGLLEESVAAHQRATDLDPTIVTSVPHTHFLRCEYEKSLETYGGTRYYLDAAAWAALGEKSHARKLLTDRLAAPGLSSAMSGLMGSLLSILNGRRKAAISTMSKTEIVREPEIVFYFARHFALAEAVLESLDCIRRARTEGFTSSQALEKDPAFEAVRQHRDFKQELKKSKDAERESRRALAQAGSLFGAKLS